MKKTEVTDRRYPIGKFEYGRKYKIDDTRKHIRYLDRVPKELKKLVKKLDHDELDTPYRKGGWTVRQVIHHLADSHMNAYIRTKLAVTEQTPIIKPYEEQLWAETEDGKRGSVKMSIKLISALHRRWVHFLESLSEDDLERGYFHPASGRVVLMQEAIALYVWHSQHHLAHIRLVANGTKEKAEKAAKAAKTKAAKGDTPAAKRGTPISASHSKINKQAVAPPPAAEEPAIKKRIRRTAEQIAADNAAKAAKVAEAQKLKEAKAAEKAARPPVDRAAILEKARAARKANLATAEPKEAKPAKKEKTTAEPVKRIRRTPEQIAADNAAKAASAAEARRVKEAKAAEKAAAKAAKPPVDRAAILEKARAARAANLAAAGPKEAQPAKGKKAAAEPGKRIRRTAEQIAADNAAKAAKQAASGTPKRSGMSPEHMTKIREARMAKRAEAIAAGLIPPPKPKVEKDPNAPKLDRAAIMEKARAARMANVAAKKAEADKA